MYAERNSRLLGQGPASDRIHRFSRRSGMGMRSHCDATVTDQSLRGQPPTPCRGDFPRDYPLAATTSLTASHTRRASPLLAGCPPGSLLTRAIHLPDKEFRYLRTVLVTAAVYRGLDSKLRPKAN